MSAKMSFEHYKPYLRHAKVVASVDEDVSKFIEYYVFKKMEHIAEKLKNEEKTEILNFIDKSGINTNKISITKEHYINFLIKLFKGIDQDERGGINSMELCSGFRLVNDLIDLIFLWETIPYEWKVISKLFN
jgi:hypothetical protein